MLHRIISSLLLALLLTHNSYASEAKSTQLLRDESVYKSTRALSLEFHSDYQRSSYTRDGNLVRRDEFTQTVISRYQLSPRFEIGANIPYLYVNDSESNNGLDAGHTSQSDIGNIALTAKYLMQGASDQSNVIVALTALPGINNINQPSLGWTQDRYKLSALLVKTINPSILFAQLGYTNVVPTTINNQSIDSGDVVHYRLGSGYAFSDQLTFSLQLIGDINLKGAINGQTTAATHSASLQFGNIITYPNQWFIEPSVRFGLTPEAADFGISIAFPVN